MKRAVTVPPAARAAFATALKAESVHAGALPDPLPMGRVLRLFDRTITPKEVTRRGDLDTDQELTVLAGEGEKGYFLDYYRVDNDDDGQTSWHGRILEDGTVEALENLEGQWGWKHFDDPAKNEAERERLLTHNTRVREILRAKGFR